MTKSPSAKVFSEVAFNIMIKRCSEFKRLAERLWWPLSVSTWVNGFHDHEIYLHLSNLLPGSFFQKSSSNISRYVKTAESLQCDLPNLPRVMPMQHSVQLPSHRSEALFLALVLLPAGVVTPQVQHVLSFQ